MPGTVLSAREPARNHAGSLQCPEAWVVRQGFSIGGEVRMPVPERSRAGRKEEALEELTAARESPAGVITHS